MTQRTRPAELAPEGRWLAGHPPGLSTLFFTELWERFSFSGMRGLLLFFLTASAAKGGLGWTAAMAGSVMGLYGALAFLGGIAGGWLADWFLGQRRAVIYGAALIMLGHLCLTGPGESNFYGGLLLLLLGTSLFKPNMNAMVGMLYAPGDRRRDAGFGIFYMGINIGSVLAPLVCGFLAQGQRFQALLRDLGLRPEHSWHWGFGAAAVGMALGLIQLLLGQRRLGDVGLAPQGLRGSDREGGLGSAGVDPQLYQEQRARLLIYAAILVIVVGALVALHTTGLYRLTMKQVVNGLSLLVLVVPVIYIPPLLLNRRLSGGERRAIGALLILFLFTILFWATEALIGSALLLVASRHVDNSVLGLPFPSVWWQSLGPILVVLVSPGLSALWLRLGPREPHSVSKFALGLFLMSLSFLVLTLASLRIAPGGARLGPAWLVLVYLLNTLSELCICPVGLSLVTKMAPPRLAGQLMGLWFLSVSVGNVIGGRALGLIDVTPLPLYFGTTALVLVLGAGLLFLIRSALRRFGG